MTSWWTITDDTSCLWKALPRLFLYYLDPLVCYDYCLAVYIWWPRELNALQLKKTHAKRQNSCTLNIFINFTTHAPNTEGERDSASSVEARMTVCLQRTELSGIQSNKPLWFSTTNCRHTRPKRWWRWRWSTWSMGYLYGASRSELGRFDVQGHWGLDQGYPMTKTILYLDYRQCVGWGGVVGIGDALVLRSSFWSCLNHSSFAAVIWLG